MYRVRQAPKAVRLGFHDCLKYTDGTGGCDGCLNWEGVDVVYPDIKFSKNKTNVNAADNNGLGNIVRSLERLYRKADYPGSSPNLGQSLFESGKSRADLWAYAAIIGVEYGMETTNLACINSTDDRVLSRSCVHDDGPDCQILPDRDFVFQYGRADCTDHDATDTYKTTKAEAHANPVANGVSTINFFRDFFGFTGRETVAIFGAHTFGQPQIKTSLFPYTWTSSGIHLFNNDYYKSITGQPRWYFRNGCYKNGDAFGQRPKSRWLAHTRKMTVRGGPVFWIHQNLIAPAKFTPADNPHSKKDQACRDEAPAGQESVADPVAGGTEPRTANQTDGDINGGCERFKLIPGRDEIALNCEMGLYREFDVTDGVIHGCPGLEHFAESMASDEKRPVWSSLPGQGRQQPECPKQRLAEPAGSTPLYQIMEEYANDQTAWINDFIATMEKMLRNGYTSLDNGPNYHDDVFCPIPATKGPARYNDVLCYETSAASTEGEPFMIGNRFSKLAGKAYQYNTNTGVFDFGDITGESNQMWRLSEDGFQAINEATGQPLAVDGNVKWIFEAEADGDVVVTNPNTDLVVDCFSARRSGKPCSTWTRHGGDNQRFYIITNT